MWRPTVVSAQAPSVGVVVVGYDSGDVWPDFFRSLAGSTTLPHTVIVVDNSPTAPLGLEDLYSGALQVIHQPENPGYGAAANTGVKQLPMECSVVLVCNPDLVFEPSTIHTLVDALSANETVGVAGPRVLNNDGSLYPSARAFPGIRIGIGHALFANIWKGNPWTRRYLGTYTGDSVQVVDWLSGACLALKREAFVEVGGFDHAYFMFLEDVDLCFRLKKAGWRSLYVPQASIVHSGAHSTKNNMVAMVRVHHDSAKTFLSRLYAKPIYWPLRAMLGVGLELRKLIAPRRYTKDPGN